MNQISNNSARPYATPFNVDLANPAFRGNIADYFRRISSLPESIKDILANPSTADFIEDELGPSFNLNPEQKTGITRIIRDVLLGDISINEVANKIYENLEIDPTVTYQIQSKIVNELFGSAIEDIKKSKKEVFTQKPPPKPAQQTPPRNQNSSINPGNVVDLRNPK